jgi:hypothetical protein
VSIEKKFSLIVENCKTGHYDVVKSALEEITHKFAELNEQCHQGISFEYDEVVSSTSTRHERRK